MLSVYFAKKSLKISIYPFRFRLLRIKHIIDNLKIMLLQGEMQS